MFRRRGCLFGCGGLLVLCAVVGLLAWFVAIPRLGDALENEISKDISTIIADEINPFYTRSELQQGADVRFSFSTINQALENENDDETVEAFRITSRGDRIVIELVLTDQTFDLEFIPRVSSDGELELEAVDDGGWWQRQLMNVASGSFEKSINTWLDQNDLQLTDVSLDGDSIILSVEGK